MRLRTEHVVTVMALAAPVLALLAAPTLAQEIAPWGGNIKRYPIGALGPNLKALPGQTIKISLSMSCFTYGGRYACIPIAPQMRYVIVWTDEFIGETKQLIDERCHNMVEANKCRANPVFEIVAADTNMEGTAIILEASRIWDKEGDPGF